MKSWKNNKRHKKFIIPLSLGLILGATLIATAPMVVNAQPESQTGWTLVWADEFNGSGQPSSTNWNYNVGNGWNNGLPGFQGWGNGEWEWYRPENCYQSGGNLVLKGEYFSTPTNIAGRDWYQRSCRITSDTKRSIQYGKIEARIQMPNANGSWPAFWMMGDTCDDTSTSNYAAAMSYYDIMATNWASCGEVDIMEHKNSETTVYNNIFWDLRTGVFPWTAGQNANYVTTYNSGNVNTFHVYAIEWTASQIRWTFDGAQTHLIDTTPATLEEFRKPFHLIMNLALGGAFPAMDPVQSQFPLFMNVDYVRVYQAGGGGSTNTPTNTAIGPTPTRTNTPVGPTPTRTNTPVPSGGVIFYADINYGGAASGSKQPGDYASLPGDVPNDWMSSLRVPAGWTVLAYEHGNFGGAVCTYTADTSWVGTTCNDKMSSFKIQNGGGGADHGVDNVSSNQARPWYKCAGTCQYVVVHYIVPGQVQQNVNATYNSGLARWEYTITGITAGQVLQYNFTYNIGGVQNDTPWFNWTKP